MAGSHAKTTGRKNRKRRKKSHFVRNGAILLLCAIAFGLGGLLWYAAFTLETEKTAASASGEDYRPQVGDPPYKVIVDAGHGGADPGARGVIEENDMTAATAAELIRLLQQDPNYIPLQTRDDLSETVTPAQRAARAAELSAQLLLSIHGNSAADASASGFECYPVVPGRTWHQESFYFAQLLADGMRTAGAGLRGRGGIRYIYYLENDQKQLVESTHTEVRQEHSFTILEDSDCPAVLAEQCFVTSKTDVAQFGSEEGRKKAARIYYEAICAYFGTEPESDQLEDFSIN